MAALRQQIVRQASGTFFHSAYLDGYGAAADMIGGFLSRPETSPRIDAAFFMVTDPRLQQLLSNATCCG
jgi:hypothetical protein